MKFHKQTLGNKEIVAGLFIYIYMSEFFFVIFLNF